MALPQLETERLILREFEPGDVATVHRLMSSEAIGANMLDIPQPFTRMEAEHYVNQYRDAILRGNRVPYAVTLKARDQLLNGDTLIGHVILTVTPEHHRAELAYWVGTEYWGNGFTTESAKRLIQYGFERLNLNRVYAFCFTVNIGSAIVMKRCGMRYEGTWRQEIIKPDAVHDVACYGLLRQEWQQQVAGKA